MCLGFKFVLLEEYIHSQDEKLTCKSFKGKFTWDFLQEVYVSLIWRVMFSQDSHTSNTAIDELTVYSHKAQKETTHREWKSKEAISCKVRLLKMSSDKTMK